MDFKIRVIENIGEDSEKQFGPLDTILDVVAGEIRSFNGVIWGNFENIQDINNYFSEEDEYETVFALVPGKRPDKVKDNTEEQAEPESLVALREVTTLSSYQEQARRTLNEDGKDFEQMASHMLMGIQGESGEVADLFKKHFHQGHDLSVEEVVEELGDVMFYIANLCNVMGISLQEVCERNIIKLMKRYPEGFSVERSINRDQLGGVEC